VVQSAGGTVSRWYSQQVVQSAGGTVNRWYSQQVVQSTQLFLTVETVYLFKIATCFKKKGGGHHWARKFKNTNRTVFKTFTFLINVKEILSLQIPLII